MEVFRRQDDAYKAEVLPLGKEKRIAVEILSSYGWHEWADHTMCLDRFGFSAPQKDILEHINYTPETLARLVEGIIDPKTLKGKANPYSNEGPSPIPPVLSDLDTPAEGEELLTLEDVELKVTEKVEPEVKADEAETPEKVSEAKAEVKAEPKQKPKKTTKK
jgi:hypothetical protein